MPPASPRPLSHPCHLEQHMCSHIIFHHILTHLTLEPTSARIKIIMYSILKFYFLIVLPPFNATPWGYRFATVYFFFLPSNPERWLHAPAALPSPTFSSLCLAGFFLFLPADLLYLHQVLVTWNDNETVDFCLDFTSMN